MDDIFSWLLTILVILAYFLPKILGFLITFGTIGFAVWAIVDMPTFMGMKGKINRGFKVSSKPLSGELKQYLAGLSGDVAEYREAPFGKDLSAFIVKRDGEVLVHAKQWYGFRFRRPWPFLGYINLLSPNPVLEFRSSLPFHLFLIALSLSIILFPLIAGIYAFSYSMDTQTIEKFLQGEVETATLQKSGSLS